MNHRNDQRREWLMAERRCLICGKYYTNQRALGRLECLEHPGTIRFGRWTCCGMMVSRDIRTVADFYDRPVAHTARGCVSCDHKETLNAYSNMPRIDYRDLKDRFDGSTVLVPAQAINKKYVIPVDAARGYSDAEFVEVYRYSRDDYRELRIKG